MTDIQHQIIELLKKDRFVSANGISILTKLSLVDIQNELSILEKEKKIRFMPFKNDKGNLLLPCLSSTINRCLILPSKP